MASIYETLRESTASGQDFVARAEELLVAAGLSLPEGSARGQLLVRIAAQRPESTWLEPGETVGDNVEKQAGNGRWMTAVTCFYDRDRLAVIEHHVQSVDGAYDHAAWAIAKRFSTAAKADVAWARLAKKYRFVSGVAAQAPTQSQKVSAVVEGEAELRAAWWRKPDDKATLGVLADLWIQHGDPRGELVQLSLVAQPTAEQRERREALIKKHGGALVGPARPFLREWELGPEGIVVAARCEATKLVEGIAQIAQLNPRLALCVTSLKTQKQAVAFSKISLAPIHFVCFTMGLIGSNGGVNLTDKVLVTAAPAFRGVKRFSLQARGFQPSCFTPAGLRAFADQLEPGIEVVVLDYYTSNEGTPLPPLADYLEVLRSHRAFAGAQIATDYHRVRALAGLS